MIKTIKQVSKDILALFSGAIVFLSLAPLNYSIIAFISTFLFIYTLDQASTKRAVLRGYLYGCGLFGCGVNWIYISIHEHGNASPILAGSLTALLIMGLLAFYPTLKALAYKYFENKLNSSNTINTAVSIISLASIWVIIDWLQGWLFTGFPWLYLGYSQTSTALASYAPLVSVFGLTWLVVFISGIAYLAVKNLYRFAQNNNNQFNLNYCLNYSVILIIIFTLGLSLKDTQWTTPSPSSEKVILVQGNIEQNRRWSPDAFQKIINTYDSLTSPYWQQSTIIWPESAISVPLPYSSDLVNNWHNKALANKSTLILGIPKQANEQGQYYNSIMAVGVGGGSHYKNKLVPWGEYVPMENIFRGLIDFFNLPMSNFISGSEQANSFNVLNSNSIKWLPFICYEIAYPDYVISHAENGSAIVTISNDTWFGNSVGPWQHLQLAQMRALETARPVIRATNNGITAIINPQGEIVKKIPQFKQGVLVDENIHAYDGLTPIMYYGITTIISLCFLLLIAIYEISFLCRRVYQPQRQDN